MGYIYICVQTACDEERAFEGEKIPLTPVFLPLGKLRFTNATICYIIISAEVRKLKVKIVTDEELPADTVVIHCRDVDENILRLKRAAEAMGSADVAFFKGGKQFFPPLDSILFFETESNFLSAHTADDVFQVKAKLFELENTLPQKFVRVSKSAIVNVKHIYSVEKGLASATLISFAGTDKQLYAGRSYLKVLKLRLGERRYL